MCALPQPTALVCQLPIKEDPMLYATFSVSTTSLLDLLFLTSHSPSNISVLLLIPVELFPPRLIYYFHTFHSYKQLINLEFVPYFFHLLWLTLIGPRLQMMPLLILEVINLQSKLQTC